MSKITPIFHGVLDSKRKIILDDKQAFTLWRCHFKDGQRIELILREHRKSRTNSQNRYLWGVVYPIISQETGYTIDEVHSAMKMLFLKVHKDGLPDTVKSTSSINTAEFSSYVDSIKQWASVTIGAYIPDASEVYQ